MINRARNGRSPTKIALSVGNAWCDELIQKALCATGTRRRQTRWLPQHRTATRLAENRRQTPGRRRRRRRGSSPNASKKYHVDAIAACHRILGRRRDVGKFIAAYLVEANLGRPGPGVIPAHIAPHPPSPWMLPGGQSSARAINAGRDLQADSGSVKSVRIVGISSTTLVKQPQRCKPSYPQPRFGPKTSTPDFTYDWKERGLI